jgi:putrescine importer
MPPFGVVSQVAHGHVVTTVLIAMVAMLFTAISYGRMARAHPNRPQAWRKVSGSTAACLNIARSVPSGMSPG